MDVNKYEKSPNGDYFVKKNVIKGVLPQILEDLISARRTVKAKLETVTDA